MTDTDPRVHDLISEPWWYDDAETSFFKLRDAPKPQTVNRFRRALRVFAERAVSLDRRRLAAFDKADIVAAAMKTSKWTVYVAGDGENAIRQRTEAEWVEAIVREITPLIIAAHEAQPTAS